MTYSFSNRIKKEMTEGMVRAILEDAQYRVIDSGIEKILRELSCLSKIEYKNLGYPDVMSHLPDFTVMNREQTVKYLVEVKYRTNWNKSLFAEIREQVKIFGEITLVSVNSNATDPKNVNQPSRFIRCCGLKFDGGIYMVQLNKKQDDETYQTVWEPVDSIKNEEKWLWWAMLTLPEKFTQLNEEANKTTLYQAVSALSGILD